MNSKKNLWQKKWSGHGWTGRTADYGPAWVSRYQKDKISLDLNEARDDRFGDGSGISWTICKQSAPRSTQITTSTPHHSIFTGLMLFLTPNQQYQSTEGRQFIDGHGILFYVEIVLRHHLANNIAAFVQNTANIMILALTDTRDNCNNNYSSSPSACRKVLWKTLGPVCHSASVSLRTAR